MIEHDYNGVCPTESSRESARRSPNRIRGKSGVAQRWRALNDFIDVTMRDLNRTEAVVWLVLFRDARVNGLVRSAQLDLARRIGVSERTIRTALKSLKGSRLVEELRKGSPEGGPSLYRIRPLFEDDQ